MKRESPKPTTSAPNSEPDNVRSLAARSGTTAEAPQSTTLKSSGAETPLKLSTKRPNPSTGKKLAMFPRDGYSRNPLLSLPRNEPCPCRSLKKYKVCCLPNMAMYIPTAMADQFAEQMKRPDLVFMTQQNQAQINQEMAERRATCKHEWDQVFSTAEGELETAHDVCKHCSVTKTEWDAALAAMEATHQ